MEIVIKRSALKALASIEPPSIAEMFEDAAALHSYMATRDEEAVSFAVAERLIAGEPPLLVWREYRGVSAEQLAQCVGVEVSAILELESGRMDGRISLWKQIAAALEVELGELV